MSSEGLNIPPPPPTQHDVEPPVLNERIIKDPQDLSAREFSKEHMHAERAALVSEIRQERREGRDKIAELKIRINLLSIKLESTIVDKEQFQKEIEQLGETRTGRADSLAGRVRGFLNFQPKTDEGPTVLVEDKESALELNTQEREDTAVELEDSMAKLIEVDASLASMRERIPAHYDEASEQMQKTVEQTMLRNGVFFVHTINEAMGLRHNANSNVLESTTFEDDIDILLSLEPSLSVSTIQTGVDEEGKVSGLWSQSGGVLISGGKVAAAHEQDIGTLSQGIKSRHAFSEAEKTAKEIDTVVTAPRRSMPGEIGGYNELVINNPEISGYFKTAERDENGVFWANSLKTREDLMGLHESYKRSPGGSEYRDASGMFNRNLSRFRERFNLIKEKGLPFYAMTPDRHFFEVTGVNENGSLEMGAELTPEIAAKARAGLSTEKRKEVGKKLLEREVFRDADTKTEASSIIDEL